MNLHQEHAHYGGDGIVVGHLGRDDDTEHDDTRETRFLFNFIPSQPVRSEDPTMMITEQERAWALALREKVSNCPFIRPLTDMECAHHAIVAQGNVAEALVRIEGLQDFRDAYNIDNSPEQGAYYNNQLELLYPGFLLQVDVCPITQEGIWVSDFTKHSCKTGLSHQSANGPDFNWQVSVVGSYYLFYTLQPTLASVREGLNSAVDAAGYSWESFSIEYFRRIHDEFMGYFHLKWRRIHAYNTAVVANLAFSMIKNFMNANMQSVYKLGCQLEGTSEDGSPRRLRETHLQSYSDRARRMRELLTIRAHHEKTFCL